MDPIETTEAPSALDSTLDAAFGDTQATPAAAPAPEPAQTPAAPPAAPAPAAESKPEEPAKHPDSRGDDDDGIPRRKAPEPAKEAPRPAAAEAKGKSKDENFAQLRASRDAEAARAAGFEKEIADLRRQITSAKEDGATSKAAELKAELDALKKERDEYGEQVKFLDYRESKEFKEKHVESLKKTWEQALKDVDGQTFKDENDQDTPITHEHIRAIFQMPSIQAAREAHRLFGNAATVVLQHRDAYQRAVRERDDAITTWKTRGDEVRAQREREQREVFEGVNRMYDSKRSDLGSKFPDLTKPRDGDAEESKLFSKTSSMIDLAFRSKGLAPGLTPAQQREAIVTAQAGVAFRAQAFPLVQHRLNTALDEIDALKAKLAKFEDSIPGDGEKVEKIEATDTTKSALDRAMDAMV